MDFFLAMAGNWLIFVYFGEEFVLLARNLYVLARKSSPDLPRRGKVFLKSSPDPPRRGKFSNFPRQILPDQTGEEKFLARGIPRH